MSLEAAARRVSRGRLRDRKSPSRNNVARIRCYGMENRLNIHLTKKPRSNPLFVVSAIASSPPGDCTMSIRAASRTGATFTGHARRIESLHVPPAQASSRESDEQDDSRRARRDTGGLSFSTAALDEDDGTYPPFPQYAGRG
jgi:hypothetical protein